MNPIEVEILELTNRIKEVGQICETLDTDCEILSSQFDRASRAYDAAKREYSTALCVGIAGALAIQSQLIETWRNMVSVRDERTGTRALHDSMQKKVNSMIETRKGLIERRITEVLNEP